MTKKTDRPYTETEHMLGELQPPARDYPQQLAGPIDSAQPAENHEH
jgi:hypothetical protein